MVHHNEPPDHSSSSSSSSPPPPQRRVPASTDVPPPPPPPLLAAQTHFRPFRHPVERSIVNSVARYLANSGFYWGPLDVEEAHARLAPLPVGTFLIRDSMQTDVFFTLSYCSAEGPTSVRVLLKDGRFSLDGSKHTFPCLFELLEFYMASPKKSLKRPYRGSAPQALQDLCRRAVVRTYGRENLQHLPVSEGLKDFLQSYPFGV